MKTLRSIVSTFALVLLAAALAFGQAPTSSTTTSAPVAATDLSITVASATGITGLGTANQVTTDFMIDRELMEVISVSGTVISVRRGAMGTPQTAHASGATVWLGPPSYFPAQAPSGSCTSTSQINLPQPIYTTGEVYTCPSSGPNNGLWTRQATPVTYNFTDGAFWVSPGDCYVADSGNGDTTQGLAVVGASSTPVITTSTTNTGTNKQTYTCMIRAPQRLTSGKGAYLTDATFFYGVQTTGLGTQAAVLASGTMNGQAVFTYIALPAAGASETASTVAPVRADSGSITITPAVASANTATTTAGAFYSVKFTPASPIALTNDLRVLYVNVTLQCAGTSATVTNSPGMLIHYTSSPI